MGMAQASSTDINLLKSRHSTTDLRYHVMLNKHDKVLAIFNATPTGMTGYISIS